MTGSDGELEAFERLSHDLDAMWVVVAGMQVFFMQVGFVMLEVGTVQAKSAINIIFKNYVDTCLGAIVWWMVGYAISFGSRDFFFRGDGLSETYNHSPDMNQWFFSFTFAATAATIVSGAMAERTKILAYFVYTMVVTSTIYPLVARVLWSEDGFFSPLNPDR